MINFYGSRINFKVSTQHSAVYNPQNGGFYIHTPKGAYKSLSCGLKHPLHRRAARGLHYQPKRISQNRTNRKNGRAWPKLSLPVAWGPKGVFGTVGDSATFFRGQSTSNRPFKKDLGIRKNTSSFRYYLFLFPIRHGTEDRGRGSFVMEMVKIPLFQLEIENRHAPAIIWKRENLIADVWVE